MFDNLNLRLFTKAKKYIPNGVNSVFRSFSGIKKDVPIFMKSGKSCYIIDCKGDSYIDMSLAWGPLVMGHSHPIINNTANSVIKDGVILGTPTEYETEFARILTKIFMKDSQCLLQTSGTEAVALALRLARAYSKKDYNICRRCIPWTC